MAQAMQPAPVEESKPAKKQRGGREDREDRGGREDRRGGRNTEAKG